MKPPRAFTLYVRSSFDAGSVAKMVEREAEALGSGLRVRDVTTVEALVGSTIVKERLLACVGGVFAFLGLHSGGIRLVRASELRRDQTDKEIGIRAALGARRLPIYGLVLKNLLGMIAGGVMVGLAGSLALIRFAQSQLFGVRAADPLVIGTAISVFVGAAIIAGALPARRAAAIDPAVALRHE